MEPHLKIRKEPMQVAPRVGNEYWDKRWYRLTGKMPIIKASKEFGMMRNFDSARCKQIVGVE